MAGGEKVSKLGPMSRTLLICMSLFLLVGQASAGPNSWKWEWPKTDFSKKLPSLKFDDIFSGGPPKDGIPAIDDPKFKPVSEITNLGEKEPVVGLTVNGEAKAYPLQVLMWHEIVNDTVGGVPVSVTFCPLCNAVIAFDRRVDGMVLDFGTTGKLRFSDLVMYDRQTESWWQQFLGQAIVGKFTGKALKALPARLESWQNFKKRAPRGKVLVPDATLMRSYGANPYVGYDTARQPFLYRGEVPKGIAPLARVVSLEKKDQAWSLELLRKKKEISLAGGIVIRWVRGQNSALDARKIANGRDVGNVTAQRQGKDIPYFVDFAFAFHAFYPKSPIHQR